MALVQAGKMSQSRLNRAIASDFRAIILLQEFNCVAKKKIADAEKVQNLRARVIARLA